MRRSRLSKMCLQGVTVMGKAILLELQYPVMSTPFGGKPKYCEFTSKEDLAREV